MAIEQFDENAHEEYGFGDYQVRRWDSLRRHLALVLLAYCFLLISPHSEDGEPALLPLRHWPFVSRRVLIRLLYSLVF